MTGGREVALPKSRLPPGYRAQKAFEKAELAPVPRSSWQSLLQRSNVIFLS